MARISDETLAEWLHRTKRGTGHLKRQKGIKRRLLDQGGSALRSGRHDGFAQMWLRQQRRSAIESPLLYASASEIVVYVVLPLVLGFLFGIFFFAYGLSG